MLSNAYLGDATDFCTVPSATQMAKAKISNGFLGMNFMPQQSLISKLSLRWSVRFRLLIRVSQNAPVSSYLCKRNDMEMNKEHPRVYLGV